MRPPFIKASVVIPTYNRAGFLRQALAGMVQQNFPGYLYEILVIDNNSADNTAAVVREFVAANPAPIYIRELRQGLDHARNFGVAAAQGDIVVFADDDILVERDWLAQLVAPFLTDGMQRIGAVGGEVIPVFPDGLPEWIRDWHSPLAFRPEAGPIPPEQCPMGANLAIPRWMFATLGYFHTGLDRDGKKYFSGGDSDMIRRIRLAGFEVWFAPAAAVRHQMPANRTTFDYARRHAFDSARSRVIDRAGRPGARLYLISRFFANVAKAAGFALAALINAVFRRQGSTKKALVRAWRSCGYLYQIPRSLFRRSGGHQGPTQPEYGTDDDGSLES